MPPGQHDASRQFSGRICDDTSRGSSRRLCAWCQTELSTTVRRDALTCSKRCRQARHRFIQGVGGPARQVEGGQPRRIAYADPPYPGKSRRYYGDHPDYAGEVDHAELVASLSAEYDAWALSTSASALPAVLALCPPTVRVAAWVKGGRSHATATAPVSSWEPVIYLPASRDGSAPFDSLVYTARPRMTDPARVVGAKPAAFARWLFELLGATPADDFTDIYSGSGGVARAWDIYAGRST